MATYQSLQCNLQEEIVFRSLFSLIVKGGIGAASTCTTHKNLSFVFRVKVDEIVACHETSLHTHSSSELCLFVSGENAFDRTVLYVVSTKDSQFDSHANTIVSTQCGAFGGEPFTIDIGLNGILVKVELNIY